MVLLYFNEELKLNNEENMITLINYSHLAMEIRHQMTHYVLTKSLIYFLHYRTVEAGVHFKVC